METDQAMKKGFVLVGFALMSWAMAGTAMAGPFSRFARTPHQQRTIPQDQLHELENGNRDKDHGEKPAPANAPNAPAPIPGHGGYGEAGQSGNVGAGQQGGRGAGGRMSVEERQKLRRQINEAGRSLYTPPGANK